MSVVYLVRRQMDSGNKSSLFPQDALPGVRCGVSLLLCSCSSEMLPKPQAQQITSNYLCWKKTNDNSNNDNNKRIHVTFHGVHSGKVVPLRLLPTNRAQCYYQPAQCQLAIILVPFKIESFTLPSTVPT